VKIVAVVYATTLTNDASKPQKQRLHTKGRAFTEFLSGFAVGTKWLSLVNSIPSVK
jgi:hypothetical protein